MLDRFDILEPATAEEAAAMLAYHGEAAAAYAGGTELLIVMKEGLAHFPYLVNLKTAAGLDRLTLSEDGQTLQVGALAKHSQLAASALIRQNAPLLAEVENAIANARVRAAGTLGGNLCFAEPHSDPATLLLAWEATVELAGPGGKRSLPMAEFLVGALETARQPDEILTRINVPIMPKGMAGAYEKFSTHERPTATVAALLQLDEGQVRQARVTIGSVGPKPVRAAQAERMLVGQTPTEALLNEAAASAAEVEADSDIYGSAEYKQHLAGVLTRRAIQQALQRAGHSHA